MGTMFSGSGVIDWQNSSDLKQGSSEPIVCLYTAAGSYADPKAPFTQCLMFSQDGAQSWQKYENNPVIRFVNIISFFRLFVVLSIKFFTNSVFDSGNTVL